MAKSLSFQQKPPSPVNSYLFRTEALIPTNLPNRRVASLVYNILVRTYRMEQNPITANGWRQLWDRSKSYFAGPVKTHIHGYPATVNFGHLYPIFARRFPNYNNPLIELVYQSYISLRRPVVLIDIGANIGDSILLLESNCPRMISSFLCVEGHPKFFEYLKLNLSPFTNGKLASILLSSVDGPVPSLVDNHSSSATAIGGVIKQARSLDSLIQESFDESADILKIDTDGFDGRILQGAEGTLRRFKPAVIFEWHPALYLETNNSLNQPFEILNTLGYTQFIFFNKYGEFNHIMMNNDKASVEALGEFCLRSRALPDWHYDVVALHESSLLSPKSLAEMGFARVRRSAY